MGVGFGLMVLIGFTANDASVAVGVGGFLVVIGIAFFVNSLIDGGSYEARQPPQSFGAASPGSSASSAPPADPLRRD